MTDKKLVVIISGDHDKNSEKFDIASANAADMQVQLFEMVTDALYANPKMGCPVCASYSMLATLMSHIFSKHTNLDLAERQMREIIKDARDSSVAFDEMLAMEALAKDAAVSEVEMQLAAIYARSKKG